MLSDRLSFDYVSEKEESLGLGTLLVYAQREWKSNSWLDIHMMIYCDGLKSTVKTTEEYRNMQSSAEWC